MTSTTVNGYLSLPSFVDMKTVKEDLPHVAIELKAKHYKSTFFATQLLRILQTLQITSWLYSAITPKAIKIRKVSGALTNSVFVVSCPSLPHIQTVLLRIYGPATGALISRPKELHTLHALSSCYGLGPLVYGTFGNGRVEEYFDSATLTAADIRQPRISRWIGARMAELHSVDIQVVEGTSPKHRGDWEIGVTRNVRSWLPAARRVVELPGFREEDRMALDLDLFEKEWERYLQWVASVEKIEGRGRRVFAHNDTQYGNLLRLTHVVEGSAEHRQIIVVDFEYASPNPSGFDIANHFNEWTANYHTPTPHYMDPSLYPNAEERRNFYVAYLKQAQIESDSNASLEDKSSEIEVRNLDRQVQIWSVASHAMWAIWGVIQAQEIIENKENEAPAEDAEFDFVAYARGRMDGFRREMNQLGL